MKPDHYANSAYNSQQIPPQKKPRELNWLGKKLKQAAATPLCHTETNSSVPRQLYEESSPSEIQAEREE